LNAPANAVVAVEPVDHIWHEVMPLLERHWAEIAHYSDIPLDVNQRKYNGLHVLGALRVFTLRLFGELVGYAAFIVDRNLHYQGSIQALQDVVFILPKYRKTGLGRQLLETADATLRAEGVQVVYHHVKHTHDFGPLLMDMGYESIETIYGRRLDK
jgi:GNAT superfamily N-acetyltransferase